MTFKSYILCKIRWYIDMGASLHIYKPIVFPYIEYGDFFFNQAASKKQINKLQTIQNQNLKLCLDLNPRNNKLKTHRLESLNFLEDRRNVYFLNLLYTKLKELKYIDNRQVNTCKYDATVIIIPPYIKTKSQNAA